MALTIAKVADEAPDYWGATPIGFFDITFDNSYPAGGYAVTAKQFGLRILSGMIAVGGNTAGAVNSYYYNSQTGKLMVLEAGAGAPVAFADTTAATDLSTFTQRFLVFGQR